MGTQLYYLRKEVYQKLYQNPIFLENVTSNSIYTEIENLIKDKKKLKLIQKESFKNPLHLIKKNTKILDSDRESCLNDKKTFYINKNSKLKILHIYNKAEKNWW